MRGGEQGSLLSPPAAERKLGKHAGEHSTAATEASSWGSGDSSVFSELGKVAGSAGLERAGLSPEGRKAAGLWVHEGGQQRIGVFPGQGGSYSSPSAGHMEGGIPAFILPDQAVLGTELCLSEPESLLGKRWL